MPNRVGSVIGILLLLPLVYGGLRAVEKGISDLIPIERPGAVISWQREDSGEIRFTFAGKTATVDLSEIYNRVLKMGDRPVR